MSKYRGSHRLRLLPDADVFAAPFEPPPPCSCLPLQAALSCMGGASGAGVGEGEHKHEELWGEGEQEIGSCGVVNWLARWLGPTPSLAPSLASRCCFRSIAASKEEIRKEC